MRRVTRAGYASVLVAVMLLTAGRSGAQSTWTFPTDLQGVGYHYGHGMAFDEARSRTVLFGGASGQASGSTWLWDGRAWSMASPAVEPPPRLEPAVAYDSIRQRVVVFGGSTGTSDLGDTWEWDGKRWIDRNPAVAPPPRSAAALAYDRSRGVLVLFGGRTYAGPILSDTWEWDGTSWTRRFPSVVPINGGAMTYDSLRRTLILVTPLPQSATLGTWVWDGSNWVRRSSTTAPSNRRDFGLCFDSARGKGVLFGGSALGSYPYYSDLWEWDGTDWSQIQTVLSPPARSHPPLCFDSARGRTVLIGGYGQVATLGDTWEWDGTGWGLMAQAPGPPPRAHGAMAFDPLRQCTVLFGGGQSSPRLDTWEWNGRSWTQRFPRTTPAGERMAYDPVRRRILLVGTGSNGMDVWQWDGMDWSLVPRTGTTPPHRPFFGLAYDDRRGRLVLYGGGFIYGRDDTWEFDGTAWSQPSPATRAPALQSHSMTFDATRGRTVLFGGMNPYPSSETWEWDGTTWERRWPPVSPSPRAHSAMIYDARRRRVLLFGGRGDSVGLQDTWEWDGTTWTEWTGSPRPGPRYGHHMAYDQARGQAVLHGGEGRIGDFRLGVYEDTWIHEEIVLTTSGPAVPGSTVLLFWNAPREASRAYMLACAFHGHPGIPLGDGRIVPLNQDPLFFMSVGSQASPFLGFAGILDPSGQAVAAVLLPGIPALSGAAFSAAGVTWRDGGISALSNEVRIEVR